MEATIGPDAWKKSTIENIKLASVVVQRSDKFNDLGRQLDPLPSLRDHCMQNSNAQIHAYVRETRAVVVKLRDSLLDCEEEIKSLLRGKENLEKALEHIRKDILMTEESKLRRRAKPIRERGTDGADDLLAAEKRHLLKLKRVLEAHLRSAQKQLQILDNARKRLKAVLSERQRVLDLKCENVSTSTRSRTSSCKDRGTVDAVNTVNPVGPFTPEAAESINLTEDAIKRSQILRQEVADAIEETQKLQKAAHKSVNDGLTKKVSESITAKQHLQMASGENRMAIHRGQRWHYATDVAKGYTLGPVSASDFTTRERLDRPMVKVYQRHPGTQLPEAQEIIEGTHGLQDSLDAISRNIGMLKLTNQRVKEDMADKNAGTKIDSGIVRYRRQKANHRWVLEDKPAIACT